jgi:hypothetical protein
MFWLRAARWLGEIPTRESESTQLTKPVPDLLIGEDRVIVGRGRKAHEFDLVYMGAWVQPAAQPGNSAERKVRCKPTHCERTSGE